MNTEADSINVPVTCFWVVDLRYIFWDEKTYICYITTLFFKQLNTMWFYYKAFSCVITVLTTVGQANRENKTKDLNVQRHTCRISMILSLVSMTRGNSLLSWLDPCWLTAVGMAERSMPVAPSVNPVTTAPMSPILRSTPPSAATPTPFFPLTS